MSAPGGGYDGRAGDGPLDEGGIDWSNVTIGSGDAPMTMEDVRLIDAIGEGRHRLARERRRHRRWPAVLAGSMMAVALVVGGLAMHFRNADDGASDAGGVHVRTADVEGRRILASDKDRERGARTVSAAISMLGDFGVQWDKVPSDDRLASTFMDQYGLLMSSGRPMDRMFEDMARPRRTVWVAFGTDSDMYPGMAAEGSPVMDKVGSTPMSADAMDMRQLTVDRSSIHTGEVSAFGKDAQGRSIMTMPVTWTSKVVRFAERPVHVDSGGHVFDLCQENCTDRQMRQAQGSYASVNRTRRTTESHTMTMDVTMVRNGKAEDGWQVWDIGGRDWKDWQWTLACAHLVR